MAVSTEARAFAVLRDVLAAPAPARGGVLARLASAEPEVVERVEQMLAHRPDPRFDTGPMTHLRARAAGVEAQVPGDRVGRYTLETRIARGGTSEVWRAVGTDGQRVALKILETHGLTAYQRSFEREVAALQRVHTEGVARLLEHGQTDSGALYLALEYVDGRSIVEYCEQKRLGVLARIALWRRVCAIVAAAHDRRVVHRDLKPSNVMVRDDGVVKVLDFGLARLLDGQGTTRTAMMTPAYAAPEQLRGGDVGPAADVYALGALLHELVAAGRGPGARDLPPSRFLPTGTPWGTASLLDRVVGECLRPQPERRPQHAAELVRSAGAFERKFAALRWTAMVRHGAATPTAKFAALTVAGLLAWGVTRRLTEESEHRAEAHASEMFRALQPLLRRGRTNRDEPISRTVARAAEHARAAGADSPTLQGRLLSDVARAAYDAGDYASAFGVAKEAFPLMLEHDRGGRCLQLLRTAGWAALSLGRLEDTAWVVERLRGWAPGPARGHALYAAELFDSAALRVQTRYRASRAGVRKALALARADQTPTHPRRARIHSAERDLAYLEMHLGDARAAVGRLEALLQTPAPGELHMLAARLRLGLARHAVGDRDGAFEELALVEAERTRPGAKLRLELYTLEALARVHLQWGRLAEAKRYLARTREAVSELAPGHPDALELGILLVDAAIADGDLERATQELAGLRSQRKHLPIDHYPRWADLELADARIAAAQGERARAREHVEAARRWNARHTEPSPVAEAFVWAMEAALAIADEDRVRARQLLASRPTLDRDAQHPETIIGELLAALAAGDPEAIEVHRERLRTWLGPGAPLRHVAERGL